MGKKTIFRVLAFTVIVTVTLILMEISLVFLLNNSEQLSGGLLRSFQLHYMHNDRKIIQFMPECAMYDEELFYTLKPGSCQTKAREFDVVYDINEIGVRDDSDSLVSPKVIVVGDSQAMGWGVAQEQTFADLIQVKTGEKILNAAISSYGTVQELRILERVDVSALEYLVIQYNGNDFEQNKRFSKNNNSLSVGPISKYESIVKTHERHTSYYFPKHSFLILNNLWRQFQFRGRATKNRTKIGKDTGPKEEALYFLNVLTSSPLELADVNVIVVEVNDRANNDNQFINELATQATIGLDKNVVKGFLAIDLSKTLSPEKYFVLDDHINEKGHEAIAEKLAAYIQ